MKFKHTVFFIILFFLVLGIYLFQNQKQAQKITAAQNSGEDFEVQIEEKGFELKKDETINFIQVFDSSRDEAFWLEFEDSEWRVVYPVRSLADQSLAQGMSGMIKMAVNQKLIRPEADWEDYGLKNPDMKIGVGTTAGPERHFLYLGKKTPLQDTIFARWDDKQAYFTLPAAVKDAFRKTVYEMREKRILLTPIPKIDKITIVLGRRTFEWVLKEGVWYWMEPLDLLGRVMDEDQIAAVIQVLSRLYIKEFADGDDFKDISAKIEMIGDKISVRSGDKTETIFIGDEAPLKTAYYAKRESEKNLFLIDQTKLLGVLDLLDALDRVNRPETLEQEAGLLDEPGPAENDLPQETA